jgi:hypothetical protein
MTSSVLIAVALELCEKYNIQEKFFLKNIFDEALLSEARKYVDDLRFTTEMKIQQALKTESLPMESCDLEEKKTVILSDARKQFYKELNQKTTF